VHPMPAGFLKQLLEEIIPATDLPADDARAFADQVLERSPILGSTTSGASSRRIKKKNSGSASCRSSPDALSRISRSPRLRTCCSPARRWSPLGEAARVPDFAAATTRWMAVLAGDGVEGALARD